MSRSHAVAPVLGTPTTAPVVELRNVQFAAFASEETNCFRASLYINGARRGEVSNDGHGGCHNFSDYAAERELNAWGATQPEVPFVAGETTINLPVTAESIVDDLFSAHMVLKDMRARLKGRIVFTKVGVAGIFQTKKLDAVHMALVLSDPKKHLPLADRILNSMPEAEAAKLWKNS